MATARRKPSLYHIRSVRGSNHMTDETDLARLFGVLDTLGTIAQAMDPRRLDALIEKLGDQDKDLASIDEPAARFAEQACAGLRAAAASDNPMLQAYRAMRSYHRALGELEGFADTMPAVGRYFLEPAMRDDPALQ